MAEGRPRVLILGGGFAGIGAAQALAKADARGRGRRRARLPHVQAAPLPVRDRPPGADGRRPPAARPREEAGKHARAQDTIEAIDLEAREVRFGELKPLSYDSLVLAVGAEVNFFGVQGAADHAFPLYTLPDAMRLKDHILERWEAADRDPSLIADGALNAVVVGGGPTGVETAGALAELYHGVFTKDYPDVPAGAATITLVEAGPDLFTMFKENLREYTARGAREAAGRGADGRGRAVGRADARHAEVRGRAARPHARLGRRPAGQRAARRARAGARSAASASPWTSTSASPRTRRCTRSGISPRSPTRRPARCFRSSGPSRSSRRARGQDHRPARTRQGAEAVQVRRQGDDGDDRAGRRRRPDARRQDDEGPKAQVAWGAVHLALLPTNEDRAKAVVDWAGSAFTHQRAGRISVHADKR